MNAKPYTTKEVQSILDRLNQPNHPDLIHTMALIRDYDSLNTYDREEYLPNILEEINDLFYNPMPDIPGAEDYQINSLKETLEKIDRGEGGLYTREGIEEQIRKIETKEPVIDIERMIATILPVDDFEEILIHEWINTEFHSNRYIEQWTEIFNRFSFSDNNKKDLADGNFTVYRAGTKEGLAWTLNMGVAKWFQNRNKNRFNITEAAKNGFLKLSVTKDDVVFYNNSLGEEEVVLIPNQNKVQIIPYHEHKDIEEVNNKVDEDED